MSGEDVLRAVESLSTLDQRDRVQQAAALLPDDLPVVELLRAADGAQRLAQALAALRRSTATDTAQQQERGLHEVRSNYS